MSVGFKVSEENVDVVKASVEELIIDSKYPYWKCDMAPSPRHYGYVDATISVAAFATKTVFSFNHGYTYEPSFLVAWTYAVGDSTDSTYGVGDLEIFAPFAAVFTTKTTSTTFSIIADNSTNSGALSNEAVKFRFYLFADDFPTYNYVPEL